VLSLALNVWFASQAREATRTRQALVAAQAQLQESQAVSHQWQAQHAEAMRTLVAVQEQLQRTTSARVLPPPHGEQQASQTRIPETFTDLRGRLYTTAELAQALFPDPTVLGASRSLAPRTSSASAPAAVILPLTFAPHTATILPQYYEDLTRLGSILTLPPYADQRLRIDGHADSLEGEASGQTLAQERAENVKRYLVEHFAIVLERLLVQGYGASQPRVTNTSPEGREQNRRVEVVPLGQASSAH
jgi:outer membrane protein OmpA-like peptidoglycan-associated protein